MRTNRLIGSIVCSRENPKDVQGDVGPKCRLTELFQRPNAWDRLTGTCLEKLHILVC